jgi:carboxyl-terminal processing protease
MRWHGFRWLLAVAFAIGACRTAWSDPTAPSPGDRQIVLAVTSLLKQNFSRHALDAEISERCLKTFLRQLDPWKLYFYQSDIDRFMEQKDKLSEAFNRKDISFAYEVFRTFLQRVDERSKTIEELLASPQDFTIDEQIVADRDAAQYPRDAAEARDLWRKRIKYELLLLKANKKEEDAEAKAAPKIDQGEKKSPQRGANAPPSEPMASNIVRPVERASRSKGAEGQEALDKLARRYRSRAKQMHQVDNEELLEMYLNAFTTAFDPHTDYMSPDSYKNFIIMMSLELEGIGATLMSEDGYTVVKETVPGGAADKDGRIKPEDKIVGVGQGEDGEIVDVVDVKLRDVVKLIRGKAGTKVRLEVMPAGTTEHKIYTITREKIELTDREAKGEIFEAGSRSDGKPYRIGVIDLPSFYRNMEGDRNGLADFKSSTQDVLAILHDFNRKHVDAVVLDLRRNGGGSLPESRSLAGLFIGDGPVVQVKDANGIIDPLDNMQAGMVWKGPLVVLVSKLSASASEIVAGAIQDYGRGLVIGDKATHGKGTVQSLVNLGEKLFDYLPNAQPMGALKITLQQFYRPSGASTQKRGVESDVELPSLTTHLDIGEADLDYPIPFDRIGPVAHKNFNFVNPAICDRLRQLSQQRVAASEKFQKDIRNIARYKEQKARKYMTLNEEKFLKERAEIDTDKEQEKAFEKHSDSRKNKIDRDYYLDEVLAITADYLNNRHAAAAPAEPVEVRN